MGVNDLFLDRFFNAESGASLQMYLEDWKTRQLRCLQCKKVYREMNNIGQWHCAVHACDFNSRRKGEFRPKNVWDCCGGDRTHLGCVPSDHKDTYGIYDEYNGGLQLPIVLFDKNSHPRNLNQIHWNPLSMSVVPMAGTDYVRVRRMDFDAFSDRGKTGLDSERPQHVSLPYNERAVKPNETPLGIKEQWHKYQPVLVIPFMQRESAKVVNHNLLPYVYTTN